MQQAAANLQVLGSSKAACTSMLIAAQKGCVYDVFLGATELRSTVEITDNRVYLGVQI